MVVWTTPSSTGPAGRVESRLVPKSDRMGVIPQYRYLCRACDWVGQWADAPAASVEFMGHRETHLLPLDEDVP